MTIIAEKISERLKFSFHETNEEKDCICKYDKSHRIEIDFDEQKFVIIGQQIENLFRNSLKKYLLHQVPGSVYMGGIFNRWINLSKDNNDTNPTNIALESLEPFIVKKSRHVKYYQEKI